ncbi:hypothetical protein H5410_015561 [Solanum commersonii]|uniref:Uncharacterized protein n=1 Tax=Solanum commersonii TaxID=4109 RepID=A0A9J5ZU42_SOLCO|nr:hypothetical protein H5410_015561 [Solanum commersonii]
MPSYLLSSACTDINSSSVSASDSTCAVLSPCTSLVVAGGILEVSGASLSLALSSSEVNRHLGGHSMSALRSNDSCCQGIYRSLKGGWEDEETPGACEEEEEGAGIPEGSEAGVGEGAFASNESTLTSGEVSAGASLLLSTSSRVN